MLEVRKNEIALRKLSGGSVQLRSCTPLRKHYMVLAVVTIYLHMYRLHNNKVSKYRHKNSLHELDWS